MEFLFVLMGLMISGGLLWLINKVFPFIPTFNEWNDIMNKIEKKD